MFELKYSYRDPSYHKPNDPPWSFPPEQIPNRFKSNIIEIQGKNGSGKSTLLNIIALAFGYLQYENELREKKVLKEKLIQLNDITDMNYMVYVNSTGNLPVSVTIQKMEKNKKIIMVNNKNVSQDELNKFDVIFLTEDNPRKVATVSIGKMNQFLGRLEKKINDASGKILQYNSLVKSYKSAKKDEKDVLDRIESCKSNILEQDNKLKELYDKKVKIDKRDEISGIYDLIKREDQIVEYYWQLKKEVGRLEGKDIDNMYDEMIKTENNIQKDGLRLHNNLEPNIRELCLQFSSYDININANKLFESDYEQLYQIKKDQEKQDESYEEYQLKLVNDLIKTLSRHPSDLTIPIINKQVSSMIQEFTRIRSRLSVNSIKDLVITLEKQLKTRESLIQKIESNEKRVKKLEKEVEGFDDFKTIIKEFDKIEMEYLMLKKLSNEDKIRILDEYEKLKDVVGSSIEIEVLIRESEVKKSVEQQMLSRQESRLQNIRENMIKKPKYADTEELLLTKYDSLFRLSQKIRKWMTIIENPTLSKNQFTDKEGSDFSLSDYNNFIQSLGKYLGQMFEPVTFSGQNHKIEFYDIELERFTTSENRNIYLRDLSVGQNKITALETSLRNLNPNRKGIILIDEIADLDNENMGRVKIILNEYYSKGLILFAVLVRPLMESNEASVKIIEW
jgi:ABC-type lipoprotein export system ATPase subunit